MERVQQSDLSGIDLVALMLDGVVLSKQAVATVALGIDASGTKHVLGFRVGSSENQEVCRDLLGNLARGLRPAPERYLLGVLDGSKALEKALLEGFPEDIDPTLSRSQGTQSEGISLYPALVRDQPPVQEAPPVPGGRSRTGSPGRYRGIPSGQKPASP